MSDLQIASLSDFFIELEKTSPSNARATLYRGHPSAAYLLKPSMFRDQSKRKDEKNIFRELISVQPRAFVEDRNVFEQLVRMQHFSLPTRLLDLTYNPLVALFFACETHPKVDGQMLTLSTAKNKVRYFDSDTVSCLANLSFLKGNERNELRKAESDEDVRTCEAGKRLLQFIRAEKSYFLPEIRVSDLNSVQLVRPKQSNPRIIAQQGAFLLFGLVSELKPRNPFAMKVSRITIPASAKPKILRDLDRVNINRATLFPEVESAAKYIMGKLVPVEGGSENGTAHATVRPRHTYLAKA
ncbi:MAG: FRG domain-containing protein [Sphingobium sp.]|uniref:FRG domain-containing protein n=1 Tax=Sphingobium sp. CECT 9361 TaxID=2845384 RepID=UPI001E40A165|nr:FRG domain-containing protein [Sphingobium sp. CECT 9361]